ncbi:uncharacterized protein LOC142530844 [Primulina tabacum]|uniref:uncharacterized protein LOC142530844 n=1 Tax=Primulina tabacum TaxID=48773 RepID=UPI003F5A459F
MALLITSPEILSLAGVRRENQSIMAAGIRRSDLRFRVSSKVKDLEKGSTEILNLKGIYLENVKQRETAPFSLRKSEGEEEEEERRNYHVNTGYAIRTLREEFPELFYRELSFDIYRDDIVFKDPFNTFAGIENYKSIFWALRFHGRIFFRVLWVDIVSVWQPSENMIMVRWIVQGIPRMPWESRSRFDGTSEYKLDKYGKIYEHKVHNIALNSPQKSHVLALEQLIQSIGCPSTPKPTYFEFSSNRMKMLCHCRSFW